MDNRACKKSSGWGKPVVIENKAGATGIVGAEQVAKADPDGHMLALVASSHAIDPSMVKEPPYDTVKGFELVALTHVTPLMLVVNNPLAPGHAAEGVVGAAGC